MEEKPPRRPLPHAAPARLQVTGAKNAISLPMFATKSLLEMPSGRSRGC